MVKSSDHHATVEEEFSKLELALNQTAGDTAVCLRLLKKQLSEYDHRNGNIFTHSATSYLRSDMRLAKDTANELKHVAHQISHSPKPSKSEVASARHAMNETSRVMEALTTTARNYDKENGQSKGIKGTIDTMIGGHHDKDKHEKHEDKKHGGLFGDKNEGHHGGGLLSHADKNGGGIMGTTETVEGLVQKNLRENFNTKALDHQISAAEKALSPSIMERAKEAIHDVKDKLKGDKTSPTHGSHGHGELGHGGPTGTHFQGGPTHVDHVHGGGPVGTHLQGGAVGSPAYSGPTHGDHVHGGGPVGAHLQGGAVGSPAYGGPTHGDHVSGGGPIGTHLQGGAVGSHGLGGPTHGDPAHGGHHSTHPSTHSTAL